MSASCKWQMADLLTPRTDTKPNSLQTLLLCVGMSQMVDLRYKTHSALYRQVLVLSGKSWSCQASLGLVEQVLVW